MTVWVCADCSTRYAADLAACPHCRSAERQNEDTMGKNTRLTGPSVATDIPAPQPEPEPDEGREVAAPLVEPDLVPAATPVPDPVPEPSDVDPDPTPGDAEAADPAEPTARPAGNALVAEWRTYVRSLGYTGAVTGKTKTDLINIARSLEG